MKRLTILMLALCFVGSLCAETRRDVYRVTVDGRRAQCPVVIRDVPDWAVSAVVRSGGREIPSQFDAPLRELAFVADVDGTRKFRVEWSSEPARREYPARVHAQMWLKNEDKSLRAVDTVSSDRDNMYHRLHHHGPAFESEYAAYRIYFDKKQTIDTYGKKSPRLELAETMWYPSDEQLAAGYGHDNLRVFGSVGVGTLKGWDAAKNRMIHITEFDRREARIIARGPVRTVVEMAVERWRYGGRRIGMVSRYILYAGHSDVQVENSITGDCDGLLFTTGVMKMAGNSFLRMGNAMAAVGCDFPENDTLKWERERVALAVAVPAGQVRADAEDKTSYLWLLAPDEHGHIDYVFDMWWRKSRWLEGVSDEAMLTGVLDAVRRAASPVRVERLR